MHFNDLKPYWSRNVKVKISGRPIGHSLVLIQLLKYQKVWNQFTVNNKVIDVVLVLLMLALHRSTHCAGVSINEFEHVNPSWKIYLICPQTSIKDFQIKVWIQCFSRYFPAGNYMFTVNNRNTRSYEICSKLTVKTPERCHCLYC